MAQKKHIVLEDDLDGSDATQTITFALDGTSYEIDLNDKHASALRDAMATYVGHARKVSGARRGRLGCLLGKRPQRQGDPRLGPLQRAQGPRALLDSFRGARGLRSRTLTRSRSGLHPLGRGRTVSRTRGYRRRAFTSILRKAGTNKTLRPT